MNKASWEESLDILMKECISNDYNINDEIIVKLHDILTFEIDEVNQIQFISILYLFMKDYKKKNNTNAVRFCVMEIREIYEFCKKKQKKRPNTLIFKDIDKMDDAILEDAKRESTFLDDTYLYMKKRLISLSLSISLIWVCFTVFLLRNQILFACMQAFSLSFLNYIFTYPKLITKFHIAQKEALESYVDKDLLEFVKKYYY